MTFPKARLVVSLCLFLAWLGFLGFLVYERKSIVLLPPQFAVAKAFISADVGDDDSTAVIKEVAWCANADDKKLLEKTGKIALPELLSCGKAQGFVGKGAYIIPLSKPDGYFEIAPIPTPGRHMSHAGLWIQDGGPNTEPVIARLFRYAKEKPREAEGFTDPLLVPMVHCLLDRWRWPDVAPNVRLGDLELPRRLPMADAVRLRNDLLNLQAKVQLSHVAELRIYPVTPETRAQLDRIIAAKQK